MVISRAISQPRRSPVLGLLPIGFGQRPFSMAMIFRDIKTGMASQFHFLADAREDVFIVTEERTHFFAMYEKGGGKA